jgi:hypothetical protein
MALVPGSLTADGNFAEADSLARSIDDALPNKPEFGKRERRELLIAIAKGIIDYLKDHAHDSFEISQAVGGGGHDHTLTIKVDQT